MFMRLIKLFVLTCFVLCNQNLFSQSGEFSLHESDKLLKDDMSRQIDEKFMSQTRILYGDIIIPEYYFVGPGDVLALQNLTSNISVQYMTVTPENTVQVPRIGEINLTGKTLKDAKATIINEIKSRNTNALISISLQQPRNVVVTLTGDVLNPGTYTIPASFRVSTVLKMLSQTSFANTSIYETDNQVIQKQNNKFRKLMFSESGLPENIKYSSRNITLVHKNGISQSVDIEEAAVTDNIALDPYIREGDEINVPGDPQIYPEISVSGEVIRPCKVPYKKTDNIEKLLKFSRGLKDNADFDNVYLVSQDGSKQKVSINTDLSIPDGKRELKPGDMIIVGSYKQIVSESASISIQGNVNSPGIYPITNNKTKLSEAIELAGGFTDNAYLPLSYILRNNKEFYNDRSTRWNFMNSFHYSDLTLEDTTRFIMDLELKKPLVSCDFVKLFVEKSESHNIALQDGDMIVVPDNPGSVYVYGQVTNPGYIQYAKDKVPEWYIEKAGGYAVKAVKSRVRVIDGRTKVWKKDNDNLSVNAGDEIFVPRPPDMPPGIELQTYAVIASALTVLISLLQIVMLLFKK